MKLVPNVCELKSKIPSYFIHSSTYSAAIGGDDVLHDMCSSRLILSLRGLEPFQLEVGKYKRTSSKKH